MVQEATFLRPRVEHKSSPGHLASCSLTQGTKEMQKNP